VSSYLAQRTSVRNSNKKNAPNPNNDARRRRGFAREIAGLEFNDRRVHRGIGKLGLSYFQFGERP
jgi:hypothetical protein